MIQWKVNDDSDADDSHMDEKRTVSHRERDYSFSFFAVFPKVDLLNFPASKKQSPGWMPYWECPVEVGRADGRGRVGDAVVKA